MARAREFHDPLYGFRSGPGEDDQRVDKSVQKDGNRLKRWVMLSGGGLAAIALLVWQSGIMSDQTPRGASTDAFARSPDSGGSEAQSVGSAPVAATVPVQPAVQRDSPAIGVVAAGKADAGGKMPDGSARLTAKGQPVSGDPGSGIGLANMLSGRIPDNQPPPIPVFGKCNGGSTDCVVDGAQFRWGKRVIELADVEVPNPRLPSCPAESVIAQRSMNRFAALLNEGPFVISPRSQGKGRRGADRHLVQRGGKSIGLMLADEGLARRPGDLSIRWC